MIFILRLSDSHLLEIDTNFEISISDHGFILEKIRVISLLVLRNQGQNNISIWIKYQPNNIDNNDQSNISIKEKFIFK